MAGLRANIFIFLQLQLRELRLTSYRLVGVRTEEAVRHELQLSDLELRLLLLQDRLSVAGDDFFFLFGLHIAAYDVRKRALEVTRRAEEFLTRWWKENKVTEEEEEEEREEERKRERRGCPCNRMWGDSSPPVGEEEELALPVSTLFFWK